MKNKYKTFDYYLQKWIFVSANSKAQAKTLFIRRLLRINGKFKFNQIIEIPK